MESSIFLRAFEPEDYLLINKWRNDYQLQAYTGGPIRYVSSAMEKEWVTDKMLHNLVDIYWAICLNDESRKMVGYISLNAIDHLSKTADAGGTVIGEKEYRDGFIVFEALLMVLRHAFEELNINRITAHCLPDHPLAPYSLQAFGFQFEGRMREAIYKRGKYRDLLAFSLLRKEYDEVNKIDGYQMMSIIKRCRDYAKNKLR